MRFADFMDGSGGPKDSRNLPHLTNTRMQEPSDDIAQANPSNRRSSTHCGCYSWGFACPGSRSWIPTTNGALTQRYGADGRLGQYRSALAESAEADGRHGAGGWKRRHQPSLPRNRFGKPWYGRSWFGRLCVRKLRIGRKLERLL